MKKPSLKKSKIASILKTKFKRNFFPILLILFFTAFTVPLAFERPHGGRSAERQGYTAGMIRMYCFDSSLPVLRSPQIHFGKNTFTLEFPIFESLQGRIARLFDSSCENVEKVSKLMSIIFSIIGILTLGLLANLLWDYQAAVISMFWLASTELWLRYSTYSMIENRTLAIALLALYFTFRRKPIPSFGFWLLTFLHKPQIFLFSAIFWLTIELSRTRRLGFFKTIKKHRRLIYAFLSASLIGLVWHLIQGHFNKLNDLPWIIHTGPRSTKWYFGDWNERLMGDFWKHLFLNWIRSTGLHLALPLLLIILPFRFFKIGFRRIVERALPYLFASLAYQFLFLNVVKVHEYYALPYVVFSALMIGAVYSHLLLRAREFRFFELRKVPVVFCLVVLGSSLGVHATKELRTYYKFTQTLNDSTDSGFQPDWNVPIFPKKHAFVVMAVHDGNGRDLLNIYLAKQHGFLWCSVNRKYAPRKFWKEQGVEYVAWGKGRDPVTHVNRWEVHSIDEELAIAKQNGWSSDINDVWATHNMHEWALLASSTGNDPCNGNEGSDPRTWK